MTRIPKRIARTLHAPELQSTENNEEVAAYAQNFEDAPRACALTRLKQRKGRHLRQEIRGRSTAPASRRAENSERVATYAKNFEDALRASVMMRRKQREGRHLRPEFRGRSTRQRHDAPRTARGSPLRPRISRTLHAPASRRAAPNPRFAFAPKISKTLHEPA